MSDSAAADGAVVIETARLTLRPWRVSEAAIQRELWAERDPRVPAARRIGADGRPTVEEVEQWIRNAPRPSSCGLLAIQRRAEADVVGYCGLTEGSPATKGEPELAYELLGRARGRGYATEASRAVLEWARENGHARVWATVWDWNTESLRVLAKLGFTETGRVVAEEADVANVIAVKDL